MTYRDREAAAGVGAALLLAGGAVALMKWAGLPGLAETPWWQALAAPAAGCACEVLLVMMWLFGYAREGQAK